MTVPRDADSPSAVTAVIAARSAADEGVPGSPPEPRFLRGLTLGVLVGAAIAGSAIWERLRHRDALLSDHRAEQDSRPG